MTIRVQDGCMDERTLSTSGAHGSPRYAAFLLRVWADESDGRLRLLIQQVGADNQTAFADWGGVARHVRACLDRGDEPESDRDGQAAPD